MFSQSGHPDRFFLVNPTENRLKRANTALIRQITALFTHTICFPLVHIAPVTYHSTQKYTNIGTNWSLAKIICQSHPSVFATTQCSTPSPTSTSVVLTATTHRLKTHPSSSCRHIFSRPSYSPLNPFPPSTKFTMYPRIPRYNKLHQNDRFTCKNCGTSYTSARGLTSHIRQQKACEHSYFPCQQDRLSLPEPHPAQPTLPVHQPHADSSSDEEDGDDLISSTTESSCESDNDFPSGPPEEEHSIMDEDSLVTPDLNPQRIVRTQTESRTHPRFPILLMNKWKLHS